MIRNSKSVASTIDAYNRGYRVDADGNVYSHRGPRKSYLKQSGYQAFTIGVGGTARYQVMVHLLAAYQKFGEEALSVGVEVRHRNNDATDNREDNLLIGNRSQNEMDKDPVARRSAAANAASKLRALTEKQVLQIREAWAQGAKGVDLAREYGVAPATISYVVNNKTYPAAA